MSEEKKRNENGAEPLPTWSLELEELTFLEDVPESALLSESSGVSARVEGSLSSQTPSPAETFPAESFGQEELAFLEESVPLPLDSPKISLPSKTPFTGTVPASSQTPSPAETFPAESFGQEELAFLEESVPLPLDSPKISLPSKTPFTGTVPASFQTPSPAEDFSADSFDLEELTLLEDVSESALAWEVPETLELAESSAVLEAPPLFSAIEARDLTAAKTLLENGCPVNQSSPNGLDPLQSAALTGNLDLVCLLLAHGAKPDPANLCLFLAADAGSKELVEFFLQKLNLLVNVRDQDGNALIHHAVDGRNPELVRFLIQNGATVRVQGAAKITPLERAAWNGDFEIVQILVEAGAEINSEGGRWSVPLTELTQPVYESVFLYGPPIYAAASRGHLEVVRFLADRGANLNAKDCRGKTVLHAASRAQNPDVMQFLLSRGAE